MSKTPAKKPSGAAPSRGPWIIAGVAVVVVALAVAVALVSRGGSDGSSAGSASSVPLAQTQPVVVTGTALPAFDSAKSPDPALGKVAPTLEGASFNGAKVTIAPGTSGKNLLTVFVAHWCPHCQREVPRLTQWIAGGQKPAGLDVALVSTAAQDGRDNYPPSAWLAKENWPTPVLVDDAKSSAAQAWGLSSFPYMVLTGTDGKVLLRLAGEIEPADLTKAIDAALKSA
jgi:cytochrome c biogenesis protein CcmG/thiol:disulfide interchange protein DsbE